MRNMSFMLTTDQIRNRTKTVTRRVGWRFLKPGDLIRAVERCQGLKKGEKMRPLAVLRVEHVSRVQLENIGRSDVDREGFPDMTVTDFVHMFCDSHRPCQPGWMVTRIEFSYVDQIATGNQASQAVASGLLPSAAPKES